MNKKPLILLTNDDGIRADGICRLARIAAGLGRLMVVAPAEQCSAMSHRISIRRPMQVREIYDFPVPVEAAWSLDGTPADCVKAALNAILPERPDFVLSGINHGYNAGFDIAYSGTVAAAMEACMNGVPAAALSVEAAAFARPVGWESTEVFGPELLREFLQSPPPAGHILNINIPGCNAADCRGVVRDTSVAPFQVVRDNMTWSSDAEGNRYLTETGILSPLEQIPTGSDARTVLDGYISVGVLRCPVL